MRFDTLSDEEIMVQLCLRIKETRIACRMSQIDLAAHAGLGIATIRRVELGESVTLSTLIGILRGLKRLHQLDNLLYDSTMRTSNQAPGPGSAPAPQRIRTKVPTVDRPEAPERVCRQDDNWGYTASAGRSLVWPCTKDAG